MCVYMELSIKLVGYDTGEGDPHSLAWSFQYENVQFDNEIECTTTAT